MLLSSHLQRLTRVRSYQALVPSAATVNMATFASPLPKEQSLQEEIDEANERYKDKIAIRQAGQRGWGLFALTAFEPHDLVMSARALNVSASSDSHTVQTDWDKHVTMDLPPRFVNHSCSANLGIRLNKAGAYDFIALQEILQGEELLWDYETSEYEIEGFTSCSCGAPTCRGELLGFRGHGQEVIDRYGASYIAPFLRTIRTGDR